MAVPGYTMSEEFYRRTRAAVPKMERLRVGDEPDIPDIPPLLEMVRFELKEDHTPGATSDAYILLPDSSDVMQPQDGQDGRRMQTITLYDPWSCFRGRAKNTLASPDDQGSRGIAWKPFDRPGYEIIAMQPAASLILGTTAEAVTTATAEFAFTFDSVLQPETGLIWQDPGVNWTGDNTGAGFEIDDDTQGILIWTPGGVWRPLDFPCPA